MLNGCCLCLSHRCVPGTRNLRYLYTSRLLTLLLSRLVYNGAAAIRPITVFISCSLLRNSPPGGGEAMPSVLRAAAGVPFWNKRMKSSALSVSGKKKVPLGRARPGAGRCAFLPQYSLRNCFDRFILLARGGRTRNKRCRARHRIIKTKWVSQDYHLN